MNFPMDGLAIDNTTWWNPNTGDSFKVKSNYFEDNIMMIQTYDNRVFPMDRMESYVMWTGKGTPPKPEPKQPQAPKQVEALPPEVANLISGGSDDYDEYLLDEDKELLGGGLVPPTPDTKPSIGIEKVQTQTPVLTQGQAPRSSDRDIIERALANAKTPEWNLYMKWPNFPKNEITLLHNIMGVSIDDISDYYLDDIVKDFEGFIKSIREEIGNYIRMEMMEEISEEVPQEAPQEEKKEPKTRTRTRKYTK